MQEVKKCPVHTRRRLRNPKLWDIWNSDSIAQRKLPERSVCVWRRGGTNVRLGQSTALLQNKSSYFTPCINNHRWQMSHCLPQGHSHSFKWTLHPIGSHHSYQSWYDKKNRGSQLWKTFCYSNQVYPDLPHKGTFSTYLVSTRSHLFKPCHSGRFLTRGAGWNSSLQSRAVWMYMYVYRGWKLEELKCGIENPNQSLKPNTNYEMEEQNVESEASMSDSSV